MGFSSDPKIEPAVMTPTEAAAEAGVVIHHVTPITPNAAFQAIMPGRAAMVSFARPDQVQLVEEVCAEIAYDNGRFTLWQRALKAGREYDEAARDPKALFAWLEERLFHAGRWAIIPDVPGAPSQINDGELNDWPFGPEKGAPVWHMDGPLSRLGRLCERYSRVCLGWIGDPKREPVGCDAYRRRMDEVAGLFGNQWPTTHMLRGVAVARDFPFASADSSSLGQNGWRYDTALDFGDRWAGRRAYADQLEGHHAHVNRRQRSFQRRASCERWGDPRPHMAGARLV